MTTPSPVNIAILGAGRQAYVHAAAIVSVGAPAVFHTTYDLFKSSAEKLSASHAHGPRVATSIEEVLSDPNVHAVIVCTPNNTHADLVIKVAAAGKACLCEKPLDTSLENVDKLRNALKEMEKTKALPYIAVGFPKRHDPSFFDLARSLLEEGDEFDTVFCHGSTMIDPASCAEAKDVMRVLVNIKTKKGVLFTLNNSRRCAVGNDQRVEAQCALGDLRAENHSRNDVNLITLSGATGGMVQPWKATTAERYAPSFINQIRELTAAVVGGGGALPPGVQIGSSVEDGWWASRTVAAAKISLAEGRMVQI
ncbi:hypothetical protein RQP46_003142 [Phenoliferia psychrophenolica]